MELELLKIYTLSADGQSYSAFPSASEQIGLTEYTYSASRMGTTGVAATVKWPVCLDSLWTGREFVVMNESSLSGNDTVLSLEKFFLLHRPGSAKASDDERYVHTLEFQSERDVVLSSVYFLDAVSSSAVSKDKYQSNNYNVTFFGTLSEFAGRFNDVLSYLGLSSRFSVTIDAGVAATEVKEISFEKATLFEALQQSYDTWNVPFYFAGNAIHFGEGSTVVPQVSFEYGADKSLLSVEKSNKNAKIVTRCSGYGSSDNIPSYYPNPTPKGTLKAKYNSSWSTDTGSLISIISQKKFAVGLDLNDTLTYVGKGATERKAYLNWNTMSAEGTEEMPCSVSLQSNISAIPRFLFNARSSFSLNGGYRGKASMGFSLTAESTDAGAEQVYVRGNDGNSLVGRSPEKVGTQGWLIVAQKVEMTISNPDNPSDEVTREVPFTVEYEDMTTANAAAGGTARSIASDSVYFPDKSVKSVIVDIADAVDNVFSGISAYTTTGDVTLKFIMTLGTVQEWWVLSGSTWTRAHFDVSLDAAAAWTAGGWKYGQKSDDYNFEDLSEIGLSYSGTVALNDVIRQDVVKYIKPSEYLMPSIYRTSDGMQRFYNAVNSTYPIPGTSPQQYYAFPNLYNALSPREHIEEFSDIMPSVKNLVDGQGNALNVFNAVFFEDGYNTEDVDAEGNLKYNYFFVKLKALGFNLLDCASADGEMTFSMLNGNCAGCQFKLVVNKKGENPVVVDNNGNLVVNQTTKRVEMLETGVIASQQDTTNTQVWVALYVDSTTFGGTEVEMGVLPNTVSKPVSGNSFAILNIDLPDSYILAAEQKLEQEIVKFMWQNNDEKYGFNIKFSRVYLAQNPQIRALLNEHCSLNLRYNGITLAAPLHVSQYTYKATDGESLPDISVELSDIIEVASSGLEKKIAAGVKDIVNVIGGGAGDVGFSDTRYIRKDIDDTVKGRPTFENGFKAGYDSGWSVNNAGESVLDVDFLSVRKKASFTQVEIDRLRQVGGRVLLSLASLRCSAVETIATSSAITGYKCSFDTRSDDGEALTNDFIVGDLAICSSFGTTTNKYYWRKVIEVGPDHVTLSNISGEYDGNDIPSAGDEIVQLGNVSDTSRQAAEILSCIGTDSPSIIAYVGINSPTLTGRDVYGFKYTQVGGSYIPYLFNYGSMLLGDRNKTNDYVEYNHTNGLMTIKANVVFKASQTLSGITEFDNLAASIDGWPTVKEALNGATAISGGLVLTNMIQLGQKENNVFTVKAGISGIYNANKTGGGIAGWYGGNMWDLEHLGSGETAAGAAKSLFRFDGTGYLASGKITWDTDGYGQLGGSSDDYVIKWDANGIKIGKNITIGSGSDTLDTVLNHIANSDKHFSTQDRTDFNNLKALLDWFGYDSVNNAIYIKKDSDNNARSFYAYGEVTSGGIGSGTPGESQFLYQLTDVYHSGVNVLRADGTARQDGDALVFSDTLSKWVASTISSSYTLPIASASTLGGIKVGSGLAIDANGVLSATGGGGGGGPYLPLTGGTLTGVLKVAAGLGVEDESGNGLLVYHPSDWSGISSSQWGVGAADSQGVIRSNNSNLLHYKGGTLHTIYDSSNCNNANTNWSCKELTCLGGLNINTSTYGAHEAVFCPNGVKRWLTGVWQDTNNFSWDVSNDSGTDWLFGRMILTPAGDMSVCGSIKPGTDNGLRLTGNNGYGTSNWWLHSYGPTFQIENTDNSTQPIVIGGSDIRFFQGGVGNVGIGTSNPTEKLEVNGAIKISETGNAASGLYSNSHISSAGYSSTLWLYNSTELHLYGTTILLASYTRVEGDLVTTGEVSSGSDRRWKENISDFADYKAILRALTPVEWDWKEGHGDGHSAGFIAQDIKDIMPYAVSGNNEDGYTLNYNAFHAVWASALQYHESKIEYLERRIKELELQLKTR